MRIDNGNKAHSLVFDSWDEFVDFAETEPNKGKVGTSARKEGKGKSWDLGIGFDGFASLARKGWSQPVAEVEGLAGHVENAVEVEVFDSSFQAVYDVAGSEVDVPVFLAGEPECMIESTPIRISRHGRAVRIIVPHFTSCGVNAESFRRRGAAIVALCDGLAKRQHPVEVVVVYQCGTYDYGRKQSSYDRFQYVVPVQAATDPLDVERLLAATAHPASFRRLGFAVMENAPDLGVAKALTLTGGYGSPVGHSLLASETDRLIGDVENTILPQDLSCYNEGRWDELGTATWVVETIDAIFN